MKNLFRVFGFLRAIWARIRGAIVANDSSNGWTRRYRVAARSHATTIFRNGQSIGVNYLTDGRSISLTFRTRYLNRGFSVPVAGDMWLDAQGEADGVDEAFGIFSNAGRDIAAVISVVMNAAIAPLEGELAFEITPGVTRRPFFQRFVEGDRMALSSRFVDCQAVTKVMDLVAGHAEQDAITRAISQYSEALNHWRLGAELPTLAHLFMGVEAIKSAMWRERLRKTGASKNQLATEWGYDPKRRMTVDEFLNAASRGILVFQGDAATLQKAKEVSDAFEHGFRNAGTLYKPARESLLSTARYLRSAIFDLAGLNEQDRTALLDKFSTPRGLGSLEMYHRSTLVGDGIKLAAAGQEYPHFQWTVDFEEAIFNEETDHYEFRPKSTMTASCGPGVHFEGHTVEVWDAGTFTPQSEA
jgi:hypothetical protein